jgi:ABC-type uncharacterized transport system YnjBCD ATPase subunit
MAPLDLTTVEFVAGARPGDEPLSIAPGTVTVLVGPNGSGKSKTLVDIWNWAQGGAFPGIVVQRIEAEWPTHDEAKELLSPYLIEGAPPGNMQIIAPSAGAGGGSETISEIEFLQAHSPAVEGNPQLESTRRRTTIRYFTAYWSGRDRFGLATDQQLTDLQTKPQTHLNVLFRDDLLRTEVRRLVHEAFGLYFVLDPTNPGQVRMRLSTTPPGDPNLERGLDDAAIDFHRQTIPLSEQSDGVQSYVGLVAALVSVPMRLILIDEPEAFLHPPLARRLGAAVADIARRRGATVFAATHSPAFLRGCVESAADTSIVRLTYERQANQGTARVLTTTELRPLLAEPLLRSSRALEGLFHRAVVVTESDADRAFYDEVNRRLVAADRGLPDAQFINAQNWQTEARIVGPLRRLGVPAAAILDIDALWEPKTAWAALFRAVGLRDGDEVRNRLEATQVTLCRDEDERQACKKRGISGYPSHRRADLRSLVGELADYGIFAVPVGELEHWLPSVGVTAKRKHDWIVEMLTKLGSNPSRADYVEPGRGDVWKFIDTVGAWTADPSRCGTP